MNNKKADKKILGIVFLSLFINLAGFAIILPLGPSMMQYYLPADGEAGGLITLWVDLARSMALTLGHENPDFITEVFFGCMLGSLYALGQFIFAPLWGRLSDRIGRRPVLLLTLWGTCLSYLLWAFASSFELFIISRAMAGIMAGNLAVITAAIADSTSRKDRAKGMGMVGAAFGLGFVLGPAIGGLSSQLNLLETFPALASYSITPFSIPAIVAFALALINIIWVVRKFGETLPVEKRDSQGAEQLTFMDRLLGVFLQGNRSVRLTNRIYFIFIVAFSGIEFTLPFLAAERFMYGAKANGFLFVYIGMVLVLVQGMIVRKLAKPVGEKNLAYVGIVSGLVSFLMIAFAQTQNIFLLGCALLALSVGLVSPSLSALISLYSNESEQGRYLGLFRSAGSLARALGPVTAAALFFYFGAQTTYLIAASILAIPSVLMLFLSAPVKNIEETSELNSSELRS